MPLITAVQLVGQSKLSNDAIKRCRAALRASDLVLLSSRVPVQF